jgi:hypothetical protein
MTPGTPQIKRIAMWSGPRNLSTALMRSFGNRSDTLVVDEPFYAHYLQITGLAHPGRDEILAHHDSDWRRVAMSLHAPLQSGIKIHYQKHMAHHLMPTMGRDWLPGLTHAFLLRNPADMLRSLGAKLETVRLEDTGLPQQLEIFERLSRENGGPPPVIDADDLLDNPQIMLERLCGALKIAFERSMLAWPAGRRETDGIWAKYWYESVERSTCFTRWQRSNAPLPPALAELERVARPLYKALHRHRLTP